MLYWKVDWGAHCDDPEYRAMITHCAREGAPGLCVEHALCQGPFQPNVSDPAELEGRQTYLEKILRAGDFIRTYDVSPEFKYSTTLYRTAEALRAARTIDGDCAIVNIEDTEIIGAALGCSLGVMRYEGEKRMKRLTYPPRRTRESVAVLRWQRTSPPFAANAVRFLTSEEMLTDEWHYPVRDKALWPCTCDETLRQSAPAVMCRNMPLPEVEAEGEVPFVAGSVHPRTGVLTLAAIPRTLPKGVFVTPKATVRCAGASISAMVGLFGRFGAVSIEFDAPIEGMRVWAQDLCANEAMDVTDQVWCDGRRLAVDGALLSQISKGDEADLPCAAICLTH